MHSRIEYIHRSGRKILFARTAFFRINKKSMRLRHRFFID
ncbi:hypothetical protein B4098_0319 [Heyndrickxia coagulans]|uniref:Uncharacterized protein n=1 Tax=Heyndrickxia coagulans TaxID=1398 RepID=A0A150JUH3_HEYCO|nr:hypothetical protein B4098_0319 [Heyndrickxia coagulans]